MQVKEALDTRILTVVAADFGLHSKINAGIIASHRQGIVTSTALLTAGPAVDHALAGLSECPDLEVGIHLALVECYAQTRRVSSLSDRLDYLSDPGQAYRPCLIRHWKPFVTRYLAGRIDLKDVRLEVQAQLDEFVKKVGRVPAFANGTQHLHLLPGVFETIRDCLEKNSVRWIRSPKTVLKMDSAGRRRLSGSVYQWLSRRALRHSPSHLRSPDSFSGFDFCGHTTEEILLQLLEALPPGHTELMLHPGFDCPDLRAKLPWAYSDFDWEGEMQAACSPRVLDALRNSTIQKRGYLQSP